MRQQSVGRAAETLALSQPAVSKTLQELEDILGASLVMRARKGAALTELGQVFYPRAAACLVELEHAVNAIAQVRERDAWMVRLGALPTVAAEIVPSAIARYVETGATAAVQVVSGPNLFLLNQLREERLDIVVGRLASPEAMRDLSFIHLYSEPVRVVVRRGHPLLDQARFDPRDITRFPVILPDRDAVIRPSVERLLITLGIGELPGRIESVSTSFGRAFVHETDAVWIISQGVVGRDLRSGEIVALAIDTADTSGPVGLTMRVDAPSRPSLEVFARALRKAADAHAQASAAASAGRG